MKKMITSAGLVVLGAASVQAQYAPAPHLTTVQTSKPWSVSASLRGFYDDNYVTRPSNSPTGIEERDSYGFEVSPSVGLNWTLPQTYIGLSYVYGMRFYEDREDNRADHSHQANVKLSHAFTERYKLDVSDSFVVAQEPEVFESVGGISVPFRIEGDNIRNTANASFTAGLTEQLSAVIGYSNNYVDYDNRGLSDLLDRMEHLASVNLRWQIVPTTVGVLGYQYGVADYDRDVFQRDSRSHYVFVGVDQAFNPQLTGSIRGGLQFTEYVDADEDTVSPYIDASASYAYAEGSYVQLGVRHTRVATDVGGAAINPTFDQEATIVYGSLSHRITAKLTGSLLAQFQHGTFEGGTVDDNSENLLLAGLNLSYQINQFLAAETGYNFDRLDSDLPDRSFSRNRVYVGIRASY